MPVAKRRRLAVDAAPSDRTVAAATAGPQQGDDVDPGVVGPSSVPR